MRNKFLVAATITILLSVSLTSAFHLRPHSYYWNGYVGSGLYNYHRFGRNQGVNPFYLDRSLKNRIVIRNQLDYQVWRDPSLLLPRHSLNNDRTYRLPYVFGRRLRTATVKSDVYGVFND